METQRSYPFSTTSHTSNVPLLFSPVSQFLFDNKLYCGAIVKHYPGWRITVMRYSGSSTCCNKTWAFFALVNMADELIYRTLWSIAIFGFTEYSDIYNAGDFHLSYHNRPVDLDPEKETIRARSSVCGPFFIWHYPMPVVVENKISTQINCIQCSLISVHWFYQRQQVFFCRRHYACRRRLPPRFPSPAFAYISPGGTSRFPAWPQ